MKKRITSVVLALCLLLPMLPTTALAAEIGSGGCGTDATWTLDESGTLTISGAGAMEDYTDSNHWGGNRSSIKTVVISPGITSIGNYAFDQCSNLARVSIPDTVISIGRFAFSKCSSLTGIDIPNSVAAIANNAFSSSGLTEISLPGSVSDLGGYVFAYCEGLTSTTIPGGIAFIPSDTFRDCKNLRDVTLPGCLNHIEDRAFQNCDQLETVHYGGSTSTWNMLVVAGFGNNPLKSAHINCDYDYSSNIRWDLSSDGTLTISGQGKMPNYMPTSSQIYEGAPWCPKYFDIKKVVISNGITNIGEWSFAKCSNLESIQIPSSVTSIGANAFRDCTGLKDVYYSGSPSGYSKILIGDTNEFLRNATIHYNPQEYTVTFNSQGGSAVASKTVTSGGKVEEPDPAPTRSGHTFGGWYKEAGCENEWNFETTVTEDITLYAKWEKEETPPAETKYTVTFDLNYTGATDAPDEQTVYSDNKVEEPDPAPTRSGYTFGGWYEDEECTEEKKWNFETAVTKDTILYAKWTENTPPEETKYTVTFDLNYTGATGAPEKQTVTDGDKATEPTPAPTRTDYIFGGWYEDEECTEEKKWNFETDTVTANTTLYAKWTENTPPVETKYTVTFELNYTGATGAPAAQTVASGGKATLPDPAPTRTGYTFGGWYKEAACTSAWNFETDTVAATTTLYAKWTENTPPAETKYTVTFELNYTGATGAPAVQTVASGGKVTEPDPAPTREGYKLDGWYKEAACTNAWNFATDTVSANTTLYAKWTVKTYTVSFNLNYTGATGAPEEKTVNHGGKATKPADPTREGYKLDGWYKEAACTNKWNFETDTVTANTTLYAKWTENTPTEPTKYTITFDLNYTGATGAPDKQTVASGGKATLPDPAPTREGYKLDGWYKEAACTSAWNFETDTVSADTTLYAKWTENTPPEETKYTVTFDLNYTGATGAPAVQTITSGEKAALPDPAPTREGYKLDGWYKEAACTNAWNFETDTVSADITLYAKWEENNSGTITSPETRYRIYTDYYTTGGRVYTSHSSATEGTRVTIEVSPRSGYELEGLVVFNVTTGRELSLTRRYYDVYTFIMPDSPVGVAVSFFGQDVDSVSWYTPDIFPVSYNNAGGKTVKWYYSDGQIRHVTDGFISSSTPLTRDMLISILYNMDPNSTGEPLFWATNQKVMPDIYQSGLWGTDKNISREQAAMLLYNYARHMGYDLSPRVDLTGCSDYDGMRSIARTAMSWAQATGLFRRNLLNMISPGSTLTCGEANTILSRFASTVARTR